MHSSKPQWHVHAHTKLALPQPPAEQPARARVQAAASLPSRFEVHPSQKATAEAVLSKMQSLLTEADPPYERFRFYVLVPNRETLRNQTLDRVAGMVKYVAEKCGGGAAALDFATLSPSEIVFKVMDDTKNLKQDNAKMARMLSKRAAGNKKLLSLLIVDEAHSWLGPAFDKFVNDKKVREATNIVTLFVSATPYNLQTCKSQIPVDNEVDMLGVDAAATLPGAAVYYGMSSYVKASTRLANGELEASSSDGYIAKDDDFEDRVKQRADELAKDEANDPRNGPRLRRLARDVPNWTTALSPELAVNTTTKPKARERSTRHG